MAAVVCVNAILPVPNDIALVSRPDELNIPVLNVKVPNANVPLVNVVVLVRDRVNVSPTVVVPDVLAIINDASVVLPLLVIVPVPTIVGVNVVNVPLGDSVNPFKLNAVVPGLNTVLVKLNVLNQLPVAKVITDVPVPVTVMFGALADVPPAVLPKKTALATVAAVVNPPVPV